MKTICPQNYGNVLPPFSLIRDFGKQNTRGNVSKVSVSLACYRQIGSKSTNHSILSLGSLWEEVVLRIQNGALTTQYGTEKRGESFLIWPIFDQNLNLQMGKSFNSSLNLFFFMIRDDPSRSELIRPGPAVRVNLVRFCTCLVPTDSVCNSCKWANVRRSIVFLSSEFCFRYSI